MKGTNAMNYLIKNSILSLRYDKMENNRI